MAARLAWSAVPYPTFSHSGFIEADLRLAEALRQRNSTTTSPLVGQNDRALGLRRWNSFGFPCSRRTSAFVVSRICTRLPVTLVPAVPATRRITDEPFFWMGFGPTYGKRNH